MKTQSLPTPGKFRVAREYPYSGDPPRSYIAVIDECGDELARMNPNTPTPIALANAELFASAPKMLARLIALGRMVEMHCCGKMIPEDLAKLSPVESAMLNGRMAAQSRDWGGAMSDTKYCRRCMTTLAPEYDFCYDCAIRALAKARETLGKYASHYQDCQCWDGMKCTCGYADALSAIDTTEQPEKETMARAESIFYALSGLTPPQCIRHIASALVPNSEVDALRVALTKITNLRWGNDGDCGAVAIAEEALS